MKRLLAASLLAISTLAAAQDRTAELDRACEETRSAYTALQQAILEHDVAAARKRYEAALKRWNDLK